MLVPESSPLRASIEAEYAAARPGPPSGGATSAERQRDYWESDLGHREADHPIVAGFSRQRWDHIGRLLPLDKVTTALDVGAGNGFSTSHAPSHISCVATDGSMRMLERHQGEDLVLADAQALPFRDDTFDLAFCWELLHHVDEPWRVLAEMRRVTRRWVLVMDPNPLNLAQFLFALADPEHRWVLRFSRGYLDDQLARAGLRKVAFQRVGLIFPNKTPEWLYPVLRAMPFRVPLIGISQLVLAEVT
jgi:ubiquinone/menaquinone biosynthesis C-methylase UbiE